MTDGLAINLNKKILLFFGQKKFKHYYYYLNLVEVYFPPDQRTDDANQICQPDLHISRIQMRPRPTRSKTGVAQYEAETLVI